MTEDDDWFERALREDDEAESEEGNSADEDENSTGENGNSANGDGNSADRDGSSADKDAEPVSDDSETSDAFGDSPSSSHPSDPSATDSPQTDSSLTDPPRSDPSSGDSSDGDTSGGGFADADPYEEADDDELFDEDFTSAFQNAPGGGGPSGGAGGGGVGGSNGGGGGSGSDGGFGGGDGGGSGGEGGFGGGDSGFGGGGGDAFGMDSGGGFGGGFEDGGDEPFGSEEFDDEEFESSIPRIDVGIDGLDSMIQGGVPERSLMTTIGSAGTGKTTFGLQFLHEALEQGENAVFITLEESHERIVNTATEKGWNFDEYVEEGSLAVIDLDPIEMANSLTSIRNDLPRLVEEFGATRLVLDSVSLLEMMYDDQATRRNEVYDFTKSLKEAGVTTMLTSEASEDSPYASRHGIIEYLVDAVFVLRYIRGTDDFRETRLAVEIQKIRDANHSREIKPYSITNEGISVYRQANIF